MEPGRYVEHLQSDGTSLLAAVKRAPLEAVPSCPPWDATALLVHTGRVHRWVTAILRSRAVSRLPRSSEAPSDFESMTSWYEEGLGDLARQLSSTDPGQEVWNWSAKEPAAASFWFRRMAQETAVHRWDAQSAASRPEPIEAELAADGIDEFLGFVIEDLPRDPIPGLQGSFTLAPSDASEVWHLDFQPDYLVVGSHAPGQAIIRGSVSDLYLWLLHRLSSSSSSITTEGDRAALDAWQAVRFE